MARRPGEGELREIARTMLVGGLASAALVLVLLSGLVLVRAEREARVYRWLTGTQVSVWDALRYDLIGDERSMELALEIMAAGGPP